MKRVTRVRGRPSWGCASGEGTLAASERVLVGPSDQKLASSAGDSAAEKTWWDVVRLYCHPPPLGASSRSGAARGRVVQRLCVCVRVDSALTSSTHLVLTPTLYSRSSRRWLFPLFLGLVDFQQRRFFRERGEGLVLGHLDPRGEDGACCRTAAMTHVYLSMAQRLSRPRTPRQSSRKIRDPNGTARFSQLAKNMW